MNGMVGRWKEVAEYIQSKINGDCIHDVTPTCNNSPERRV